MRNSLQSLFLLLIILSLISGQVENSFNNNIAGDGSLNNNANTMVGGTTRSPLPGSGGSRISPSPRFPSLSESRFPQFLPPGGRFGYPGFHGFGGYGWLPYGGFGGYGWRRYGKKYPYGRLRGSNGRGQGVPGRFGGTGLGGIGGFGGPDLGGSAGLGGVSGFGGIGPGGFPEPVGPPGTG